MRLVIIKDKDLAGEPSVGFAIARDHVEAIDIGNAAILDLAERGRGRCTYRVLVVEPGTMYRLSSFFRLPE